MSKNVDVRASLAMSRGATVVAEAGALLSDQGVPLPLDKGDLHALVLAPVRNCDHHATRAISATESQADALGLEFNTAEHIITVAGLKIHMQEAYKGTHDEDAVTYLLELDWDHETKVKLTYGQIVALAGDFYGDPDRPICFAGDLQAQKAQFFANFLQMRSHPDEVVKILDIAHRYEFEPIRARLAKNQVPSGAYENIPWSGGVMNDEDQEFDQVTGGGGRGSMSFGRYTHLAEKNFDHFGQFAKAAWTAGHIRAQEEAVRVHKARYSDTLGIGLRSCYAINAFADHFLTDLFAAGHMRTPRKDLFDADVKGGAPRISSGYCVKGMHDEDNKFGLQVENKLGDKWVAYGDSRYRDWPNAANRRIMKRALQQSIDDVWNAFQTGVVTTESKVLSFLPTIIDSSHLESVRGDRKNWAPLFWSDAGGWVYQRGSVASGSIRNLKDYDNYSYYWAIHRTGPWLRNERGNFYMPDTEYKRANHKYPPDEKGPSGEVGWPAGPTGLVGYARVSAATGPNIKNPPVEWKVDGTPEPSHG